MHLPRFAKFGVGLVSYRLVKVSYGSNYCEHYHVYKTYHQDNSIQIEIKKGILLVRVTFIVSELNR